MIPKLFCHGMSKHYTIVDFVSMFLQPPRFCHGMPNPVLSSNDVYFHVSVWYNLPALLGRYAFAVPCCDRSTWLYRLVTHNSSSYKQRNQILLLDCDICNVV